MSAWGGVCLGEGVSAWGASYLPRGCLPRGCPPHPDPEADTSPDPEADALPTQRKTLPRLRGIHLHCGQTDTCKKHYLSATTVTDGKYYIVIVMSSGIFAYRRKW